MNERRMTQRISTITRVTVNAMLVTVALALTISVFSFFTYRHSSVEYHGEMAVSIAAAAAALIDPVRFCASVQADAPDAYWYELEDTFNAIFARVGGLAFLYVFTVTDDSEVIYYLSARRPGEAPSVYFGQVEEPGVYSEASIALMRAGQVRTTGIIDAGYWGMMVSASVPIFDEVGQVLGHVGVDIMADHVVREASQFGLITSGFAFAGALAAGLFLRYSLKKSLFFSLRRIGGRKGENTTRMFNNRVTDKGSTEEIAALYANFAEIYNGFQETLAEQRRLEALLQAEMKSEREIGGQIQLMLDSAPLGVCMYDESGNAFGCNQEALNMYRLAAKEELFDGEKIFMPVNQPDGRNSREVFHDAIETAKRAGYIRIEHTAMRKDGTVFPMASTFVRVPYHASYVIIEYNQDMTEIKEAIRRELEADESSRAKSRFLAHMSHEIRTPMNAVMGISEIMLQKDHPPETEEAFKRIHISSTLLLGIINDILDLSKVEAGKMEILPAPYDVADMIVSTVQLNLMHIGSHKIEFKLLVDENLPAHFIGDELRIKQVMNNLLSNAFKYTTEGAVTLAVGLGEAAQPGEEMLRITVTDTGPGMSREQLDRLFDLEYTRFNVSHNRAVEGSGLGMTIVKRLVSMMDGRIDIQSTPGTGTVFTVNLPQRANGEARLGSEVVESLENLEVTQLSLMKLKEFNFEPLSGRVLVVDDVETNLYVAKGILMPFKLYVETAISGFEAIEKIKNGKTYDIIFMDHMMPEMDGVETTRILREMGCVQPIIALTANAILGVDEIYMSQGFSGYLSKPVDVGLLYGFLARFLRDKPPTEAP